MCGQYKKSLTVMMGKYAILFLILGDYLMLDVCKLVKTSLLIAFFGLYLSTSNEPQAAGDPSTSKLFTSLIKCVDEVDFH